MTEPTGRSYLPLNNVLLLAEGLYSGQIVQMVESDSFD